MRKVPRRWVRMGRRERFIASYEFPPGLAGKIARARPDLEGRGVDQALQGLRDWLRICRAAGPAGFVAMPSRAADAAWHEFMGIDADRPDRLPRIFALDEALDLEDGIRWRPPEPGSGEGPSALRRGDAGTALWVPAAFAGGGGSGCGGGGSFDGGGGDGGGGGGCAGGCG